MTTGRAAFTIVRDEAFWLPLWVKYYSRYFRPEDIYVLDNGTVDGSTANLPVQVIPKPSEYAFNHKWLRDTVQGFQHELLTRYQTVLFAEVDEFLWHPNGLDALIDSMETNKIDAVRASGHHIVQDLDTEPVLDPALPFLTQRQFWTNGAFGYPSFDKTLISRVPLHWDLGFHWLLTPCEGAKYEPDLRLMHLHYLDYNVVFQRHLARAQMKWSPTDKKNGWGWQNAVADEEKLKGGFRQFRGAAEPIPEEIRNGFVLP